MKSENKKLKAIQDLEKAKTLSAEEQVRLAIKYYRKSSASHDYQVAFEIFSLASKQNNVQAMNYLAKMYYEGLFVEKNISKTVEYLKQASNLGSISAKCFLASIAGAGECENLKLEDCEKYYQEAAALGSLYAKFCLADIYRNGFCVPKNLDRAIEYYLVCAEADKNSKNMGILAQSYFGLIQCYLEKQYTEEANATRDVKYYNSVKKNKEQAKLYLFEADKIRDFVSEKNKENFENALKVYSSILNENEVDLKNMFYSDFKKQFYNKHSRIFLPTKISEHLIYAEGIKSYFFKREDFDEEFDYCLKQKEQMLEKRKNVLKNTVADLKISNNTNQLAFEECVKEMTKEISDFKKSYLVDYSTCVINIDKYLEEILHYIFVVKMHDFKKENINLKIKNQESLIQKLIQKLSLESLKEFNSAVNGVVSNSGKINEEKHISIINSFISKMINSKTAKNVNKHLHNLNKYEIGSSIEQDVVYNMIKLGEIVKESSALKMDMTFQLGCLFDLTFVEHDDLKISSPNKLKDEILSFVQTINTKLTKNEIYLKLHELILKIESFRVMVRNIASHKSILTQSAFEKGLNLCVVQDSSIFNLIDDLFGEYIENEIYRKDLKNFISKTEKEYVNKTVQKSTFKTDDDSHDLML